MATRGNFEIPAAKFIDIIDVPRPYLRIPNKPAAPIEVPIGTPITMSTIKIPKSIIAAVILRLHLLI